MNTTKSEMPDGCHNGRIRCQERAGTTTGSEASSLAWIWSVLVMLTLTGSSSLAKAATYDLATVKDINAFAGSAAAKELLAKNGFVVADPAFKQIFEPYIKSVETGEPSHANPMGTSLPSFITTDSAWHTYHVLLEEGVKDLEELQCARLRDFSRRLLAAAGDPETGTDRAELAQFAAIGLALQDAAYRQSLGAEERRIVDGLRAGTETVPVPIGFDLSPVQFRAQSFYTQSPELSDYFAARQWYAEVVFRLDNQRETKLAVTLARLVNDHPELLTLWQQLSDPYDALLARTEDGTVAQYAAITRTVTGPDKAALTEGQLTKIQQRLKKQLPQPQVNDQLLNQGQYLHFGEETRGFRLLPPRRLPCAVCFQNTVDPKIPGREYPSGLDFMAASPDLRSPAAVRAVQMEFGKEVGARIVNTDCGPLPDSLHGEAMRLLAGLQKPLPASAPAACRTEAWSDLQLWSQLGAWAEQRHTWALHEKLTYGLRGIISPPKGMVAPYPDFFSGLATLARRTATAFGKAGLDEPFEPKAVAAQLVASLKLSEQLQKHGDENAFAAADSQMEQTRTFEQAYYNAHRAELEANGGQNGYWKIQMIMDEFARRCAAAGAVTNAADLELLRSFYDCRQNMTRVLNNFAPVCDRLAALAGKAIHHEALTDEDAKWIENYGVTLAGFHFYRGNSYEAPQDDFPIVTRVFSSPLSSSLLYAGLARPQALYIIIPDGKSWQLYRGAVMTYREFVRPAGELLDDESWRKMATQGQLPPPPPFTRSFYADMGVAELLEKLQPQNRGEHFDYEQWEDLMSAVDFRATAKDVPVLLKAMIQAGKDDEHYGDYVANLAQTIGHLPWEPYQQDLLELLASPDSGLAEAATTILADRPAALDVRHLIADFSHQPPWARRYYCVLLSRQPQPTGAVHELLLRALHDPVDGVRWQAAMAIKQAGWKDRESVAALLQTLDDTNQVVACAGVHALIKLGITNAAPKLLARLKTQLTASNLPPEELERQARVITGHGGNQLAVGVLDVDGLGDSIGIGTAVGNRQPTGLRLPPQPESNWPVELYDLPSVLIKALGDLNYTPAVDVLAHFIGTEYEDGATQALGKLDRASATASLLATAGNRQVDSFIREKMLLTLVSINATNCVRDLIPLLDDTTPIVYSQAPFGKEWRVCDRALLTILGLLDWYQPAPITIMTNQQRREALMQKVRDWAKNNGQMAN